MPEHAPPAVEQDGAEHVEDPVETVEQGRPAGDEDRAEDQRAQHSVEQHAVLVQPRDGEVSEDQREHEDVVHREALLDQVSGEVLAARRGAVDPPHQAAEGQAE